MKKKSLGFTLIELMIVVAILGILASVGYPSYQEHVRKSERAVAQTALLGLSSAMERFYSENNTYTGAAVPAIFPNTVPTDGGTTTHALSVKITDSGAGYELKADPVLSSEKDLTITHTGLKKYGTTVGWRD
ncbi:type IV pilin protein [Psychrobium sp. 1_MG-2023]|uniref:type IV pilin protein n=1 Tax=Psychrobium sp. 1_MG-2023 TaxID=3062624 RepID=UPI000C32A08D|nr:type IV pilin protein [Psychrobium sp. 1_MG-2023]MDP2561849.1 type IV pilin protein [Psychrobium sp. 1_MG-2023]PKF55780.1 hypothetical protein CW748_11600 [Alteromonadales bacterium alter-6D02]